MKNIYILSLLTFREALSKKIFLFFFSISTFVVVVFALLFSLGSAESFTATFTAQGTNLNFENAIAGGIKLFLTYPLYAGGMFLSIFSVAGFIPSLLEKGNIDLILSKPVSRAQIILGKFFGGTAMVFANVFYAIFMLWVLIGLKFGVWDLSFLLVAFTITLAFASIYSLIILIGVLTESSTFSLVISYLIFFILSPILSSVNSSPYFSTDGFKGILIKSLYYLVPQTSDISSITTSLVIGSPLTNPIPIFTTFVYVIIILKVTIFIFSKKDY